MGAAIGRGLRAAGLTVALCPVADGGEGTLAVLAAALGASLQTVAVSDPLGRPVSASFALAGDVAIIEMAAASGLQLVGPQERDARHAKHFFDEGDIAALQEQFPGERKSFHLFAQSVWLHAVISL